MIPTRLDNIKLLWKYHKSALWWLGLLYRRPAEFNETIKLSIKKKKNYGVKLYFHFIIYMILFITIWRLSFLEILHIVEVTPVISFLKLIAIVIAFGIFSSIIIRSKNCIVIGIILGITYFIGFGIGFGIANGMVIEVFIAIILGIIIGIVVEVVFEIISGIAYGLSLGIAVGIFIGLTFGITLGIIRGIGLAFGIGVVGGLLVRVVREIPVGIFRWIIGEAKIRIGVGIAAGIILGITAGIGIGVAAIFGFIISDLRIYYQPLNLIFIFPGIQGRTYPYHPVAWDDLCSIPFPGLDRLLVSYWEFQPQAGAKEIERLIDYYPSQRKPALRAKTIILARKAAQVNKLTSLDLFVSQLPEGEKGFLAQLPQIRQMVHKICRLQIRLETINRPILREPFARMVKDEIEIFRHKIVGYSDPTLGEFRRAADHWLKIAKQQLQQVQAILLKEPTLQIFRAGDPVDRDQEAFVPRFSVVGDLEQQVMLRTGCPGIVLYGQRRMGKTTIIRNLQGFLPGSVIPILISMQNPEAFSSLLDFNRHLVSNLQTAFSPVLFVPGDTNTLTDLFRILTSLNAIMQEKNQRVLLAIDEYEYIDVKIGVKILPIDLIATIRESIQTHRNLTWIFAGSHEITELKNAQWTSYLVSIRTIEVPLFTPEETRSLLTEPMKYSTLWEKNSPQRPRFDASFWGENGIERVHHEAGGWPHLVQLIAETIVDLINDEDKRQVDEDLFNRALNKAIVSGHNVLYQLMRGESTLPGEWEYLSTFRKRETQSPPDDENIYRSLRRRLLVAEEGGEWRLRVPLMERWLKQRF